jgi:hypothetical protein
MRTGGMNWVRRKVCRKRSVTGFIPASACCPLQGTPGKTYRRDEGLSVAKIPAQFTISPADPPPPPCQRHELRRA